MNYSGVGSIAQSPNPFLLQFKHVLHFQSSYCSFQLLSLHILAYDIVLNWADIHLPLLRVSIFRHFFHADFQRDFSLSQIFINILSLHQLLFPCISFSFACFFTPIVYSKMPLVSSLSSLVDPLAHFFPNCVLKLYYLCGSLEILIVWMLFNIFLTSLHFSLKKGSPKHCWGPSFFLSS